MRLGECPDVSSRRHETTKARSEPRRHEDHEGAKPTTKARSQPRRHEDHEGAKPTTKARSQALQRTQKHSATALRRRPALQVSVFLRFSGLPRDLRAFVVYGVRSSLCSLRS